MINFSFGLGKQTTTNEDKLETTNTQAMSNHDNMKVYGYANIHIIVNHFTISQLQ